MNKLLKKKPAVATEANGAILSLRWLPSTSGGWIDVERGLIHRRAAGAKETKKRQPPARIPAKLLPWLRRWRAEDARTGASYVINYDGKGVGKLRRSVPARAAGFGLAERVAATKSTI